ncbi:hypothetical protein NC652_011939 [Populus alba x Populus x berolinensis]|nr:hypothetical protein NC652_011939 [Populus alba x Populus x berolinensis]
MNLLFTLLLESNDLDLDIRRAEFDRFSQKYSQWLIGEQILTYGECFTGLNSPRKALITGGSSCVGDSAAGLFAKHGAKVVIADIQDERGHSVCEELKIESASFVHVTLLKKKMLKIVLTQLLLKIN